MACILANNIGKGCLDAVAGVKQAWIYKNSDIDQSSTVETDGVITTFAAVSSPSSATPLYSYEFFSETALCEANSETNKEHGTTFWNHTATFPIAKMTTETRVELEVLVAMEFSVIVLDNNGTYWVFGYANGLTNAGTKSSTGKALGDANGYIVSAAGNEPKGAIEIDYAAFSALINP